MDILIDNMDKIGYKWIFFGCLFRKCPEFISKSSKDILSYTLYHFTSISYPLIPWGRTTRVELASFSDEAPTASRSINLRKIHRQIDYNDMLKRRLAHSTKLLHNTVHIAMGYGND
jgi:hypothetical protein